MNNELERLMPQYDFNETHELLVQASPQEAFDALKNVDFADSPLLRFLFFIRGLKPHRFDELTNFFTPLYMKEGEEWDLGLIGKPWTPTGHILYLSPEAFRSFDTPGYAKMVWQFYFVKEGENTLVKTETRILCLDDASRKRFKWYWFFVKPFSGLVRRKILKMIENKVALNQNSAYG